MEEKKLISMEELFEKKASQQMVSEANQFQTVKPGVYGLRATKYEATANPKQQVVDVVTGETRDRIQVNFNVDIIGEDGARKAKAFLRVSPDEFRYEKGYLDGQSKMYGQLTKALFPGVTEQPSVGELIQVFMQQPVKGYVGLQFKGPKDPVTGKDIYISPKTEDEENDCRKKGYTPSNVIRSVQAA